MLIARRSFNFLTIKKILEQINESELENSTNKTTIINVGTIQIHFSG